MNRSDFEHLIAAAAQVADEDELVVIGSQAVLGAHSHPPAELLVSMEADIYPRWAPEKADQIDGALGDGSFFHAQYGYYAHAVGPETAKAPDGWMTRLVPVQIPPRPAQLGATLQQDRGLAQLMLDADAGELPIAVAPGGELREHEVVGLHAERDRGALGGRRQRAPVI